jgi:hypothetical protein
LDNALNRRFVASKILAALEAQGLSHMLWNVDLDDWEIPLHASDLRRWYVPGQRQTWLFHEMPVNSRTLSIFDNGIDRELPSILDELARLSYEGIDAKQPEPLLR